MHLWHNTTVVENAARSVLCRMTIIPASSKSRPVAFACLLLFLRISATFTSKDASAVRDACNKAREEVHLVLREYACLVRDHTLDVPQSLV